MTATPSEACSVGTRRARWRSLVAVAAALVLFAGGALVGATVFGGDEVPAQATVLTFEA